MMHAFVPNFVANGYTTAKHGYTALTEKNKINAEWNVITQIAMPNWQNNAITERPIQMKSAPKSAKNISETKKNTQQDRKHIGSPIRKIGMLNINGAGKSFLGRIALQTLEAGL